MQLIQATEAHIAGYADEYCDLIYATGAPSFDYQFPNRDLFNHVVRASWQTAGSLFAYDATTLALDGDELLGIAVGFPATEYEPRKKALAPVWSQLVESNAVLNEKLAEIAVRGYQCSYLTAAIPSRVYFLHALAVKTSQRGKGIGVKLVRHALAKAAQAKLRALHLDVLSDNPAVDFYTALGMHCLVETTAPVPLQHGVPMHMRMAVDVAG